MLFRWEIINFSAAQLAAMLHDPRAFARLSRKMRASEPVRESAETPAVAELIARIDAALATRKPPRD